MSRQAIEIVQKCIETGDTYLDLGNCGLRDEDFAPGSELNGLLQQCTQLETLILSNAWWEWSESKGYFTEKKSQNNGTPNLIGTHPPTLPALPLLTALVCGGDRNKSWKITDMEFVIHFPRLKSLYLGNNQITELKGLDKLTTLQYFYISNNQITELKGLDKLTTLQDFDISNNQITELKGLDTLTTLQYFDISYNKITELKGLDKLTTLQAFYIYNNQITELKGLDNLTTLLYIDISNNQITELKGLDKLTTLQAFYIYNNQITELKGLDNLTALQKFNIQFNQITELKGLDKLTSLQNFDISYNHITDLRPLLSLQPFIEDRLVFNFGGNPLVAPPVEVMNEGREAIINYFKDLDTQGRAYLYEAKMLIVGQPRAGKTSLRCKLFDVNADLPEEDETTYGIDIQQLSFPITDKQGAPRDFKYNAWDFGGQAKYQAVNQFFLSHRTLYVMVIDSGKNADGNEDPGVNYWLQVVELLGGGSPLLLVMNEKNAHHLDIDLGKKRERFGFLKGDFAVNLDELVAGTPKFKEERLKQFTKLREEIELQLRHLPLVGFEMPANWVKIRNELQALSLEVPYISIDQYIELCIANNVTEYQRQMELSKIFHDLGVFLHFQDIPALAQMIILQNRWATDAVFAVFDSEIVRHNEGKFNDDDLKKIWEHTKYELKVHHQLLELMKQFELCYKAEHNQHFRYIIPEMLPNKTPDGYHWNAENNLPLRYEYDFMPRGIFTRLVIRLNQHIAIDGGKHLVWKSGVKINGSGLDCPGSFAEITEEWDNKHLLVRVNGNFAKNLMSKISYEIDMLNRQLFSQVSERPGTQKLNWHKLVPCNCDTCRHADDKHFFDYRDLLKRKNSPKRTIECGKDPYYDVPIMALVDFFDSEPARASDEGPSYEPGGLWRGEKAMRAVQERFIIHNNINVIQNTSQKTDVTNTVTNAVTLPPAAKEDHDAIMALLQELRAAEQHNEKWQAMLLDCISVIKEIATEPDKTVQVKKAKTLWEQVKDFKDVAGAFLLPVDIVHKIPELASMLENLWQHLKL